LAGGRPVHTGTREIEMNRNMRKPLQNLIGLVCVGAVCSTIGCNWGGSSPVNAARAREYLQTALESWKKGDSSETLKKGSPPIYIIDLEWQSGAKLVDYQLVSDEEKDAMLYSKVKLTVKDANGKDVQKDVTFMISTAPNVTVSRKLF
jgi:hypothetical protein